MTMLKETARPEILDLEVPYSFSNRQDAAQTVIGLNQETLAISESQRKILENWIEILDHPELQQLIDEGKITLFIIKPQAYDRENPTLNDQEAADLILSEITADKIVGPISLQLSREQVERFYEPNKETQTLKKANKEQTVWDVVTAHASSGPLSFGLAYYENGDAVESWRAQMGSTVPEEAHPKSIRGKYALGEKLPNNLVHGSDSIESVKREVKIIRDILAEIYNNSETVAQKFPTESFFTQLSLITEGETLKSMRIVNGSVQLEVIDETGKISTRSYRTENN